MVRKPKQQALFYIGWILKTSIKPCYKQQESNSCKCHSVGRGGNGDRSSWSPVRSCDWCAITHGRSSSASFFLSLRFMMLAFLGGGSIFQVFLGFLFWPVPGVTVFLEETQLGASWGVSCFLLCASPQQPSNAVAWKPCRRTAFLGFLFHYRLLNKYALGWAGGW